MERSQKTDDSPYGIETTRREVLLRRAVVSGKESCKQDSIEKSTGEAENRGCTVDTGKDRIMHPPPRSEDRVEQQDYW